MFAVEVLNSQLAPKVTEKTENFKKIQEWIDSPDSTMNLYNEGSKGRDKIETFIANQYSRVYQANIHEFMPNLVAFRCRNKLSAAVGIKQATDKPLFVEQYLDKPVHVEISEHAQTTVQRKDIIEVGNLAASWKGTSQLIFVMLPVILERAGYKWVILTATGLVERLLRKLYYKPITLCSADQSRINNDADDWGDYYNQTTPHVLTGSIEGVEKRLLRHRLLRYLIRHFDSQMNEIVDQLKLSK